MATNMTVFESSDDRLSMAASFVISQLCHYGEAADHESAELAEFDGSGYLFHRTMDAIKVKLADLGYTPKSFLEAVIERTSERYAYQIGFFNLLAIDQF